MPKRSALSWPACLVLLALLVISAIMVGPFEAWDALKKAKKLQTLNDANQLRQGIENFESEYMEPLRLTTSDLFTDSPEGQTLLIVLLGKEEVGASMQNPKQILFVSFKENKNKNKGGLVYAHAGARVRPQGLYDAWGKPFRVVLRNPGSAHLAFSYGGKTVALDQPAAVISRGPDQIEGNQDDVVTWQSPASSPNRKMHPGSIVFGVAAILGLIAILSYGNHLRKTRSAKAR